MWKNVNFFLSIQVQGILVLSRHEVIVIYDHNQLQSITVFQVIIIVIDYPLNFLK